VIGVLARGGRERSSLGETPEPVFGIRHCLGSLGALAETLVWIASPARTPPAGCPTAPFQRCAGSSRSAGFLRAADPQAKGCVERLQDQCSFGPGRVVANELDSQDQLCRRGTCGPAIGGPPAWRAG